MAEKGLEFLHNIAGQTAESKSSRMLNRIAQSLDLPIEAFYGLDQHGPADGRRIDRETERLLEVVKVHLQQLDPSARRRFGEAVLAMGGPEPAES